MIDLILRIHEHAWRLKKLKRSGWIERGVEDPESVASHSYSVALLTMIIADLRGLDPSNLLRMALIHDLAESITGDLTPRMKERMRVEELERRFFEDLMKGVPEEVARKYLDAWRRYSTSSDELAKLVKDIDKLEMGLQAVKYMDEGYERAEEIYRSALSQIEDEELKRVLEAAAERT